jgi:iron complex outermembrane receptor protein
MVSTRYLWPAAIAGVVGSGAWLGSPPVGAQSKPVEEVIVTARQREESLADVPAAITAFTESDIANAGIKRAEDFVALTPGVSLVNTAEVGDTQISIRGINGTRDGEASFAFIVDGILYTNPSAFNREFANLQQIEVLKGPQGALYGRNASAGAIIVNTRAPGDQFDAGFTASAGEYGLVTGSGFVGGPLIKGKLSGGISGDYRTFDGFYQNAFTGERDGIDRFENYNVNGRLLWEPNDRLSVDTKFRYGEVDAGAIVFNASFFLQDFGGGERGTFEQDVNNQAFRFTNNIRSQNEQESTEFSIKLDYDFGPATLTAWGLYSNVDQFFFADGTSGDFGFFTGIEGIGTPADDLTAIEQTCIDSAQALNNAGFTLNPPAIFDNGFGGIVGLPGAGGGATVFGPYTPTTCDGTQYQIRDQQDVSFEFRLTSNNDGPLRWQVGAYFLDLEREVGVNLGADDGSGSPPAGLIIPGNTESLLYDRFNTSVYAAFGNIAYDLTSNVEVALALRYDVEDRKVTNLVPADLRTSYVDLDPNVALPFSGPFNGGSPLNPALVEYDPDTNAIIGFRDSVPDRSETFEQLQPKVSINWSITDFFSVYGSWGMGFKSGGFNNQGSADFIDIFFNDLYVVPSGGEPLAINDVFEKEVNNSFEIGFKSSPNDRINLEGALYYTNVDDMQFFEFFVGTFGLLRVVTNIDDVDIFGGELAATARLTDRLTLFGGVGFVDGEIKENRNRPATVGNEVPYAPEMTANVGLQVLQPVASGKLDFFGRIDYSFVGDTWFHTLQEGDVVPNVFSGVAFGGGVFPQSNLTFAKRDAYGLVNLRAGLQSDTWAVTAFINNLTGERFLNEVIPAPEFGGAFVSPGTLQAWGLEASFRFGNN